MDENGTVQIEKVEPFPEGMVRFLSELAMRTLEETLKKGDKNPEAVRLLGHLMWLEELRRTAPEKFLVDGAKGYFYEVDDLVRTMAWSMEKMGVKYPCGLEG